MHILLHFIIKTSLFPDIFCIPLRNVHSYTLSCTASEGALEKPLRPVFFETV